MVLFPAAMIFMTRNPYPRQVTNNENDEIRTIKITSIAWNWKRLTLVAQKMLSRGMELFTLFKTWRLKTLCIIMATSYEYLRPHHSSFIDKAMNKFA